MDDEKPLDPLIRNAVRALIICQGRLLVLKKAGGPKGTRYALPGGAQSAGETLQQALIRECREEIAASVTVNDIVFVADHFKNREPRRPSTRHHVEFVFTCQLPDDYVPRNGDRPDRSQIDVLWLALEQLESAPFYPYSLARHIRALGQNGQPIYLNIID